MTNTDNLLNDILAFCSEHAIEPNEDSNINNEHESFMWNAIHENYGWRGSDQVTTDAEETIREAMYIS